MAQQKSGYLSARARELAERAEVDEYSFIYSKLLSPSEQIEFYSALKDARDSVRHRCFFFGGCREATRRAAVFVPAYIDVDGAPFSDAKSIFSTEKEELLQSFTEGYELSEVCGIVPLEIRGSGFVTLCHRDYMGSLLGLGLERDAVGEIAVTGEHGAVAFVSASVAAYICESLVKVGRDTVACTPCTVERDFTPLRAFSPINAVAASERVDSVVASLTGMSRSEAKEACLADTVEVNYIPCRGPDMKLSEGDVLSVRGHGKYVIDNFGGETRSGRLRLSARKYV